MNRHLFVVNSHTTYLTALGTIDFLGLSFESITFVYVRNYKNRNFQNKAKIVDLSQLFASASTIYEDESRRNVDVIAKKIDSIIDVSINGPFHLYVPHLAHPFFQILYTNIKCIDVAYIQEGGIPFSKTYKTSFSLKEKIRYSIKRLSAHSNRIWHPMAWYVKGSLYKQSNLDSYALNNEFFKYLPSSNHIIRWPIIKTDFKFRQGHSIFVFDGFVANKCIEPDYYLQVLRRLIGQYSNEYNYLKFHPAQTEEEMGKICRCFIEMEKSYEILDNDIAFEFFLISNKKLNIIGLGSSLLYFAQDLGHHVICKDEWLMESPLYLRYKKNCGFESFASYYKGRNDGKW